MRKQMRLQSFALAIACAICSISINPVSVQAADYWPEGPEVESPCAIVMEATTGTILYEKNSHEQHYPASITKIMTTLLALENSSMDETVTFSQDSIYKTEGSGIARDVDEQMTMEQCLYAIMLASANECAYAVAEHVGGDIDTFVDMMNERAAEIGCTDTHFANPHGLNDPEHYTTCYDMALIAREAYKNEKFRLITGTARYTIPPTNKHAEETYLQNHNEMLYPFKTTKYLYEYCVGGKTGYTTDANSTLVTYAEKDGMTLICVILNASSPSQWTDSTNLYNYCFDNFQTLSVADNETRYQEDGVDAGSLNVNGSYADLDPDGIIVIPKTAEFSEAEPEISYDNAEGDVIASINYTFAGHDVGGADIVATGAKIEPFAFDNLNGETETQTEALSGEKADTKTITISPLKILEVIAAIAGVALLLYAIKKLFDKYPLIYRKFFSKKRFRGRKYCIIKSSRKYRSRKKKKRYFFKKGLK